MTALLCFAHAGGGPSLYRSWGRVLAPTVTVHAVALPGREQRWREPPLQTFDTLVEHCLESVTPLVHSATTWAVFGHSLGAVVGFEVARTVIGRGGSRPRRFYASASPAPCRPAWLAADDQVAAVLSDRHVTQTVGTVGNGLDDDSKALLVRALLADLRARRDYRHVAEPRLPIPISVLVGANDDLVTPADLQGWSDATSAGVVVHSFPGGHMYVRKPRELLAFLRTDLASAS